MNTQTFGGRLDHGFRRGHKVVKSKATHKIDWLQFVKKSRNGTSCVNYKPVLVRKNAE